ncbi:MAG: hypothetical protein KDB00_13415 [Planctomycetales bacterium]|nr:hypothetical protein [Planctomycetales bacterium]
MTNAVCNTDVLELLPSTQNETVDQDVILSDAEIMRRVRDIRAAWSNSERRARRKEANRRFENLIETLFAEAA